MSEMKMAKYIGKPEPTEEDPAPHDQVLLLHPVGDGSFLIGDDEKPLDVANEWGTAFPRDVLVWIAAVVGERKKGDPEWQIVAVEAT